MFSAPLDLHVRLTELFFLLYIIQYVIVVLSHQMNGLVLKNIFFVVTVRGLQLMKSRTVGHNNYATYKFQMRIYMKTVLSADPFEAKMKTCTCRPDKFLNSHVPCSCTGKEEGG